MVTTQTRKHIIVNLFQSGIMSAPLIGDAERRYIIGGAELNVRNDGRGQGDFRRIEVQVGVIPQANGSARVRLGGTDVIVGVKAELGVPDEARPSAGRLMFSVECSPVASPAFRGRGGDELSSEISKALERSMYVGPSGSHPPIDMNSLCVVSGKSCWILYVDALVLDIDGAAIDAVSMAVKLALADARIPRVELVYGDQPGAEPELEVDDDPDNAVRLDVVNVPVILSVCRLGNACVMDPTGEEEECASIAVGVAVDGSGTMSGVTKRGEGRIDPTTLLV